MSWNSYQKTFFVVAVLCGAFSLPVVAHAANPTVSSFSPADGATGISQGTNLVIVFSEAVTASGTTIGGTGGTISLYKSDGSLVESFTASGSSRVTVSSATVTIDPSADLVKNTDYYVQITTHAFVNASDEPFLGIFDTTTWNFRTIGGGAAANRAIRAALLENQVAYYDTEAPSLSSVGIYQPVATEDGETYTAAPPESDVSPELQEELQERNRLMMHPVENLSTATPQQYVSALHERVCKRVERRFAGNRKMIDRINARLTKRFGFTCDL